MNATARTQTRLFLQECRDETDEPVLFLRGARVGLRALEKADIGQHYLDWLNDREITRYLETGMFPLTLESLQRYYEGVVGNAGGMPSCVFFAIQHLETGRHIGNIKLEPIHWVHRTAVLGILIGEKRLHGQGLGEEAMRLCLEYAFTRLWLRKVSLGVLAANTRAVRLYQRLGFVLEGCKRQEYYIDGQLEDGLMMGLLREEFEAASADAIRSSPANIPTPIA